VGKAVQNVVSFFVMYGDAQERDREIYEYGITILFSTMINLIITVIIGFVARIPLPLLAYCIPFLLLRGLAGGYHAKTFLRCVMFSSCIIIGVVLLILYIPRTFYLPFTGVFIIVSILIVYRYAPVVSTSRRIEKKDYSKMRKRAFSVLGLTTSVCLLLYLAGSMLQMFCVSLGAVVASMTLLIKHK